MQNPGEQKGVVSPAIWQGRLAKYAIALFCAGVALQVFTVVVARIVPGRS
jgi:hypothetical protein